MRIAYCSDLHLEFGTPFDPTNTTNADVLVLAGDICLAADLDKFPGGLEYNNGKPISYRAELAAMYRKFLRTAASEYNHVLYVLGNHESYKGNLDETLAIIRCTCEEISPRIKVLQNESITIDGVSFFGSTLWTDCNKNNPVTEFELRQVMADYRVIRLAKAGYRKLQPHDTMREHHHAVTALGEHLRTVTEPVVVITHHAPSELSVNQIYAGAFHENGGYRSDLSDIMLDNPAIKLWIHGHMHIPCEYTIGATRVVCNPGDYPDARDPDYSIRVIEV